MSLSAAPSLAESIAGRPYTIAPLNMEALGRLQNFLNRVPYPKDTLSIKARLDALRDAGAITEEEAIERKREAVAEEMTWPAEIIFDPRARGVFMYDAAGRAEFLAVVLGLPSGSEEAGQIAATISIPQFLRVFGAALAIEEEAPGPKADGGGSTGGPGPASTTS